MLDWREERTEVGGGKGWAVAVWLRAVEITLPPPPPRITTTTTGQRIMTRLIRLLPFGRRVLTVVKGLPAGESCFCFGSA